MKKIIGIFIMTLLIGTVASQVSACTGFTASDDNTVLVGSNEDGHDHNFNIRFMPPDGEKYGYMTSEMGYPLEGLDPNWYAPFCGMNDQGLFFDSYATPFLIPVNSSDKPVYYDKTDYYKYSLIGYCIANCATVEEVVSKFNQYNLEWMDNEQILWVDSTGSSVIIEGDDIIYKEGDFQVVSNFLQSHPELGGLGNAFERQDIAVSMLENMTDFTVEYFTDICIATHQEKSNSCSLYSLICDLKNQIIYIYYFYDYENMVVIDLKEELEKDENYICLGSLFEPEGNQGPGKPEPLIGNETGSIRVEYSYSVRKIKDPDDDLVSYRWDWGDGTFSHWIPAPAVGAYLSAYHIWDEEGTYEVRVKAMDMYGSEGEWSDPLVVSMPKTRIIIDFNSWIIRLIQRFPILEVLMY